MVVDASVTPASAAWVVLPKGHPARNAILSHAESHRLGESSMVALHGEEGRFCQAVLAKHYPQLFEGDDVTRKVAKKAGRGPEAPPDPAGLFNILARAGHSLPSAVADLVDNSLSAGANNIDITFPNPNQGGRWMCIRDDGVGMTPEHLLTAMEIGHQRDYASPDLGKFGYGLKGAAWSQADRLTVVSKAANAQQSVRTWDRDHLAKTHRWELLSDPVEAKYASAVALGKSGTAVLLTKMRPPLEPPKARGVEPFAQEVATIRDHLELVFHRFLGGAVPGRQKVVIRLNDVPLRPNDPMGHPLTKPFDARSVELPAQQGRAQRPIITVRPYVLPNEAEFNEHHKTDAPETVREARDRLTLNARANESQGFYFYRLNRLIKWGGWEGIFTKDEHTKWLRVAVDFDRLAEDHLHVDISKQQVHLPVALTDSLKTIIQGARKEARDRYKRGAKPPTGVRTGSGTGAPGGAAGTSGGSGGNGLRGPKPTGTGPTAQPRGERSPLRLVDGGGAAWERKMGFKGEQVEISPLVPELVRLVGAVDNNFEATVALSEFLRVLEKAGVVPLLTNGANGR